MHSLNPFERMIIESLSKESKTINHLHLDTGINEVVIQNSIISLLTQNIIEKKVNLYQINPYLKQDQKEMLWSKTSINNEIRFLINEITQAENEKVFFYKVSMNDIEQKILKSMLLNLESFLQGLKNNKKSQTRSEHIIYWGRTTYENAINTIIN